MAFPSGKGRGRWGVVCAFLVPVFLGAATSIVLPEWKVRVGPDGGYEGVTVSIAEGLVVEDRHELLDQLKALLRRTSDLLFDATEGRIFFAELTILVPWSWKEASEAVYIGKLDDATIRIDVPSPDHGHLPYAQATRPCGKTGEYIHLTPEAVTGRILANETAGDVARALVQAWARYRWGIFEEHGHPGDALYPYFRHMSVGGWEPTGCSSGYSGILRTSSGGKCREGEDGRPEEDCRFFPDKKGINQEACIMYQHDLKSPPKFCSDGTHDRLAPNRQNSLCNHRSSWAVMEEHEDFRRIRMPKRTKKHDTLFHLARLSGDTLVNVLMLLDVSKGDQPKDVGRSKIWKYLRTELKGLVDSLPHGSSVGVATYEGKGEKYRLKELVQFSPLIRAAERESLKMVLDSIKGGEETCGDAALALGDAAAMVDSPGGDVFLVFTQMRRGCGAISETTKIRTLQERRIRVMGLSFLGPQSASGMPDLCVRTGGRWVTARKDTLREDIKDFVGFVSSTKSVDNRLWQMSAGMLRLGPGESNQAIVFVEKGLGRCPSFSIESSEGMAADLLTPGGKKIDVARDKACSLVRGQHHCSFDVAETGNWTINVTCLGSPCSSQTTVGFEAYSYQRLEPKDFERQQPTASFWTSGMGGGIVDLSKEDFLVYARIRIGYAPVVDLDVTVTAESSNTSSDTYSMNLSDDGLDPDVRAGDGVYTGMIVPDTSETLLLSLSIKGTGRTSLPKEKDSRWSDLELDRGTSGSNSNEVVSPGRECMMQRTLVKFTTVKGTGVARRKARPQRISDFMVIQPVRWNSDAAFVTLRWTSPNPRDGSNKVMRYLLYFSFDLSTILNVDYSMNASSLEARDIFPDGGLAPLSAGEEQNVISRVRLKRNETAVYFRIQSINSLEAKSEFSRVVPVYLKEVEDISTTDLFDEDALNYTRNYLHVRNGVSSTKEGKNDLLYQAMALPPNSSTGNNSTPTRATPVTRKSWFVPVVATVCVLFAVACAVAAFLLLRSRSRQRQNSLKEAMLTCSWLTGGGGGPRKGGPEEEGGGGGGQVQKAYGQGVWGCMSRGYPSTGNLAATVANVGRVEAERWVASMEQKAFDNAAYEPPQEEDREAAPEGECPEGAGPYKEVFIRHPDDVTTEL